MELIIAYLAGVFTGIILAISFYRFRAGKWLEEEISSDYNYSD